MKILNRWTDAVLWEGEAGTVAEAVYAALKSDANLRDADLRGANLHGANLRGANLRDADLHGANLGGADLGDADLRDANLRDADLRGANLGDADLRGANLHGANLRGANLRDADLHGANLGGADLRGANLRGANLRGANLHGANLHGANLGDADLTIVRDDIWAILSAAPTEVPGLLAAVREGRIDGSTYSGQCACLVGTIANVKGCAYDDLAPLLGTDSSRPAEAFFTAIYPGDTPATNQASKLAEGWIADWLDRMQSAFALVGLGVTAPPETEERK
jgi:hypothetical protein